MSTRSRGIVDVLQRQAEARSSVRTATVARLMLISLTACESVPTVVTHDSISWPKTETFVLLGGGGLPPIVGTSRNIRQNCAPK